MPFDKKPKLVIDAALSKFAGDISASASIEDVMENAVQAVVATPWIRSIYEARSALDLIITALIAEFPIGEEPGKLTFSWYARRPKGHPGQRQQIMTRLDYVWEERENKEK